MGSVVVVALDCIFVDNSTVPPFSGSGGRSETFWSPLSLIIETILDTTCFFLWLVVSEGEFSEDRRPWSSVCISFVDALLRVAAVGRGRGDDIEYDDSPDKDSLNSLSAAAIQSMGGGKDDRIFGGDRLDPWEKKRRGTIDWVRTSSCDTETLTNPRTTENK